jgi:hypothetical protein
MVIFVAPVATILAILAILASACLEKRTKSDLSMKGVLDWGYSEVQT